MNTVLSPREHPSVGASGQTPKIHTDAENGFPQVFLSDV